MKNLRLTRFFFYIYVFVCFFLLLYEVTSLGRAGIVGSKFLLARRSKKKIKKKWKYIADVFCASPCTIPLRHRAFELCALGCRSEQSGGEAAAARRSYLHKESVTVWRKEKLSLFFTLHQLPQAGFKCAQFGAKKKKEKENSARHAAAYDQLFSPLPSLTSSP